MQSKKTFLRRSIARNNNDHRDIAGCMPSSPEIDSLNMVEDQLVCERLFLASTISKSATITGAPVFDFVKIEPGELTSLATRPQSPVFGEFCKRECVW